MVKVVLGRVTCRNNIYSWDVSKIYFYQNNCIVHSPPFSHKGCSWNIVLLQQQSTIFIAYLERNEVDEGPEIIRVSFSLGFRKEHGPVLEEPLKLNWIFTRGSYDTPHSDLPMEGKKITKPLSMCSSKGIITCRFLEEEDLAQLVDLTNLNQEVDPWKKKFNEAQATISKLRADIADLIEEKKSTMNEVANLKKLNKELELEALSSDFRELLSSGEKSDVVLKVKGREFPVHKSVLVARSPVLRATFSHDSEEEKTGMVTIPDCDPESFPLFLSFLYSGRVGELTVDTAQLLYVTSDKYDLQSLKSICRDHLKQNLTPESVCDVAVLADRHFDDDLMSAAQLYFNGNYLSILQTSEWMTTLHNNPRVTAKLLKEMASAATKESEKM